MRRDYEKEEKKTKSERRRWGKFESKKEKIYEKRGVKEVKEKREGNGEEENRRVIEVK